jgi:hypothetical protein
MAQVHRMQARGPMLQLVAWTVAAATCLWQWWMPRALLAQEKRKFKIKLNFVREMGPI